MSLLAKRYATALHLAAKAAGAVEQVEGQLQSLHLGLQDRAVRDLMVSPDVGEQQRDAVISKLSAGMHPLVANLMRVAQRRRRLSVLSDISPAYSRLCMQERGEIEGIVQTPKPLSAADMQTVQATADRLSGKKCRLSVEVRPELIGGIRLILGNVSYDGSVQSTLRQLEQQLLQANV